MARRVASLAAAVALAAALLCGAGASDASRASSVARGLSFDFYKRSCPNAEAIVRSFVQDAVRRDVGLAAGLLRLHFHDCFVQGCDASVLLDGSATGPGEKQAPPNLTLRPSAFKAINDIHDRLTKACGGAIVSCSDVVALAARDSVVVSGGPSYRVPLGRRDSASFATQQDVLASLPPPTATVPALLAVLSKIGLDAADLVALSGGHTIGLGHCTSFESRLFPRPDPTLNATFAGRLRPADLPRQGHRPQDAPRRAHTQRVRQQVLRQPGEPGGALHLRPGPLHQPGNKARRRQVRRRPEGVLRPVRLLHGQDGADQGAHRLIAGPDPQKLLRAQPRHAGVVNPRRGS
ncbi:unnamed protein product [Urochloa humidicola]